MSTKLKDNHGRVIGEIEIRGSRKIIKDAHGKVLGEFDGKVTRDSHGRRVGDGDLLTMLLNK